MTVASILEGVRAFVATYTGNDPLNVDYLGTAIPGYSIVSLPGGGWIEGGRYLNGGGMKEFLFAVQSKQSTADELERMDNNGFFEAFSDWLDTQTEAGTLPELPSGKTAEVIETVGAGFLYEHGVSDTGTYQVTCRLEYEVEP
jgi:hypothetical protein